MPFLPLFIVIGLFLAVSKTFQPKQQPQPFIADDGEDQALSRALIDYITRESDSSINSKYGRKTGYKSSKSFK